MKVFLILIFLVGSVLFADRPKIGLVLSGGGARGGAHVGILKVLEEKNIPIDMIVGTSMGSFVGGLYASGKTPQEIESMLVSSDWKDYIRTDFNRRDIPIRKKELEYYYQGKLGLGIDVENNIALPTGVLKRQPLLFKFLRETQHAQSIKDFDKFPIPFRAVATNIKNGEAVVLKSGSLARAIYASSSIPGGLQPININGIDLVDGGVSENMPIDLAKEMGADIVIAVDVSEDFNKELKVDSYFVIMGQLVDILMRKNVNKSILKLTGEDILLTPDLSGFSGLDADKYASIIQTGVDVTRAQYENKLKKLSLSNEEYAQYKKKHRAKQEFKAPIIDEIRINNPTYLGDRAILDKLHVGLGTKLDEEVLRADLLHIYNMMIFDSVDYSVKNVNGRNILVITTTPSWDTHGEIRFALGLEDDFRGHSSYSLKFGYTMFGLNEYGGEWKNDFEIGKRKRAYTEIFQPSDCTNQYYFKPSLVYGNWINLMPASQLSFGNNGTVELDVERYGGTFAVGTHITTDYDFEVGYSLYHDNLEVALLDRKENFRARPLYASIKSDDLDNLNFPNEGIRSKILWTKETQELGSDYDYEQIYLDIEKPFVFGYHNITAFLKYGNTYRNNIAALAGSFTLGGLFNMSGYAPYSLIGENMFLGLLKYRYEIKNGGFFGALNTPLYAGFSAEVGNTWTKDDNFNYDIMKKSGTIYVAADTVLGPFYLAYGFSEAGEHTGYLYLGEKF
ncbi:patatin-like phospholipase family protein [bacterium]|nr:patatin-like phospholipase family protein [bacterium]MBU1994008.1 patatin-like phospholipase family protein [bacterium]